MAPADEEMCRHVDILRTALSGVFYFCGFIYFESEGVQMEQ